MNPLEESEPLGLGNDDRAARKRKSKNRPSGLGLAGLGLEGLGLDGLGPANQARGQEDPSKPWKWTVGRLTYVHKQPSGAHAPVVENVPLTAETMRSAFVSGYFSPTTAANAYSGGVYRHDGTIVPEFLEYDALTQHRVPKRVNPAVVDAARVKEAARIDGTCVYMGPLAGHFGHFLLESLQRAWYLKDADPTTLLLFHGKSEQVRLPSFARAVFEALEVDPSRIRVAARDVHVATLILPASQFWQGIKASPGMCVAFDHIREAMLKRRAKSQPTPAKVYFTRRSLSSERGPGRPRAVITNEDEAELLFRRKGYEILRPETLPPEEQVAIVANATHVAGASGSALHLMLFNGNPRTTLIELRTKAASNQLLISSIRPAAAFHIWSAAPGSSPEKTILDMDVIERAMKEID